MENESQNLSYDWLTIDSFEAPKITQDCINFCKEGIESYVLPFFNNVEVWGVSLVWFALVCAALQDAFFSYSFWWEKKGLTKIQINNISSFFSFMVWAFLMTFLLWWIFPIVRYRIIG